MFIFVFAFLPCESGSLKKTTKGTFIPDKEVDEVIRELITQKGQSNRFRIERGVQGVTRFWKKEDGTVADFKKFCKNYFITEEEVLDRTFARMEINCETIWGNLARISRILSEPLELDMGNPLVIDHLFAGYSPFAHLNDDFFKNKIAMFIVLNFPHFTLEEKLQLGSGWTRKQWARAAAGDLFVSREPAALEQSLYSAFSETFYYISKYKIHMGKLLDKNNNPGFPDDLILTTHWGIRDEIRAQFKEKNGRDKQEMIFQVMLHIINQTIPREVINSGKYFWNPFTNVIYRKVSGNLVRKKATPEGGDRYRKILERFRLECNRDKYHPFFSTKIKRSFDKERQMSFNRVEKLFIQILESPQVVKVAELIRKRLKRSLRPFDIWYDGFAPRGKLSTMKLDKIVQAKYPDVSALQNDLPFILRSKGFTESQIRLLTDHIAVDPARGEGHAWPPYMKNDKARLRTRFFPKGLRAINFHTALHEFGHTVENIFSLHKIDYHLLHGVPNSAFSECFAYIFGNFDIDLLGLEREDPLRKYRSVLNQFWLTVETSAISILDMRIWQWLYQHPQATVSEFQRVVIRIANDIWNTYFARIFMEKDVPILAVYNHLIGDPLYFPDYPLGYIIHHQVVHYLDGKPFGPEMERMCSIGKVTPDLWMKQAVGAELSADSFLNAVNRAMAKFGK
jgi:hypothetical protein